MKNDYIEIIIALSLITLLLSVAYLINQVKFNEHIQKLQLQVNQLKFEQEYMEFVIEDNERQNKYGESRNKVQLQ